MLFAAGLAVGGCSADRTAAPRPADQVGAERDLTASPSQDPNAVSSNGDTDREMIDDGLAGDPGSTGQTAADTTVPPLPATDHTGGTDDPERHAEGGDGAGAQSETPAVVVDALPGPLDEAGALACANAESGLYRMQDGDHTDAGEKTMAASEWASATADERLLTGGRALVVDITDARWESSVRSFLEICRDAGYQPL